jgi:uroporphyrinogen-III synthase
VPRIELSGWRVLVTRPQEQAAPLCERIQQHGGAAIRLPLLVISPSRHPQRARLLFSQLASYQWLIFISANAVYQGWPYVRQFGGIPPNLHIAAVGKATANAVVAQGGKVDVMPSQDFSSEGLLALPELQAVQGQRFLIVRGEGGKETLANVLRQRGAAVDYAEVYQRDRPAVQLSQLLDKRGAPGIDVIAISSGEALQYLAELAQAQQSSWLFDLPLVVVHARQITLAKQLGFTLTPQVADNASDAAVVATLVRARALQHTHSTAAKE